VCQFRLSLHTVTFAYGKILQHPATHCNTLQHTALHCNTLQQNSLFSTSQILYRICRLKNSPSRNTKSPQKKTSAGGLGSGRAAVVDVSVAVFSTCSICFQVESVVFFKWVCGSDCVACGIGGEGGEGDTCERERDWCGRDKERSFYFLDGVWVYSVWCRKEGGEGGGGGSAHV